MSTTNNNLNYNRAIAKLSPEEFREFNGPFFVKNVYERIDGKKTDKVVNRFCVRLKGPLNADGTAPSSSLGDQLAFVSTAFGDKAIDPKDAEFAAFFDDKGDIQWILQRKGVDFVEEAAMVFA